MSDIPATNTQLETALAGAEKVLTAAEQRVGLKLRNGSGKIDPALLEKDQLAAHGFAWLSTYVAGLRETLGWTKRLESIGKLGQVEQRIATAAFAEYLNQISGGIALSQGEIVRPDDLGLEAADLAPIETPEVMAIRQSGWSAEARISLAEAIMDGDFGDLGLDDETLELIQQQFSRFVDEKIIGPAHEWHLNDELIPMDIVEEMAELGVFGLTVPEEFGGLGMGKVAMCVVTEELSRGYIGVGSLGTRSEIASELIRLGGTQDQKERWLRPIATGEVLPTAVFTEPDTGSDLGSLRTRAVQNGKTYKVTGTKTWITHAARADVMTLLARTNPEAPGYRGLSMFIAPKTRGTDADPFPNDGITGGEIKVLGYRGMKEYEIGFDGFEIDSENLLGQEEGQGFKQLMATFESARIQTAARSVGVATRALEVALSYANERRQFGKSIVHFPRVAGKLAWMAVETMVARQLTYFAARQKDSDRRCDIEAGMAKLLAARTAWSNADNGVQIHGGNGYAEEYEMSRLLCDARILNIFEGAAEIQAQVIARGLLDRRN
ncbi:MAG: acyl-CoA dehydrogenase family protein [Rhodospirillales bacterium]